MSFLIEPGHSEEEIWDNLQKYLSQLCGITSMLYGICHSRATVARTGITNSLIIKTNHPEEYLAQFAPDKMLDDDSSALRLLYDTAPFLWTDTTNWTGNTPEQTERSEFDRTFGLEAGMSMGFSFSDGQGISGIGLAARYMDPQQFAAIWQEKGAAVVALLQKVEPFLRARMIENRFKLTVREKEVLLFSAGGLTAKEIARHFRISPRTVFNTLERARTRMLANTTAEAVAKAYVYRLI